MEFRIKNDYVLPSTSYCTPKAEVQEQKDEKVVITIDSEEEDPEIKNIKTEFSITENYFSNIFVDVSKTVKSAENILVDETNPLLINVDPLSQKEEINGTEYKEENFKKLPTCKNGCYLKITAEDRRQMLCAYSKKNTFQSKFNFVNDMTVMVPTLVNDREFPGRFKKIYNTTFYIQTVQGLQIVCQNCFRLTINETENFIASVVVKKFLKFNDSLDPKKGNIDMETNKNLNPKVIQKIDKLERAKKANNKVQQISAAKKYVASSHLLRDIKIQEGWTRLPECKNQCFLRISAYDQKCIFDSYWQQATFYSRLKFMQKMAQISDKIYYQEVDRYINAEYNANYYLNTAQGKQRVCKSCFTIVLAESHRFVTEVLNEKFEKLDRMKESKEKRVENSNADMKNLNTQKMNKRDSFHLFSNDSTRFTWSRLTPCKSNCYLRVTEVDQLRTFDAYRRATTLLDRFNFLKRMTGMLSEERPDVKNPGSIIRQYIAVYFLNTKEGPQKVCESCFHQTINEAEFLKYAVLEEKWHEIRALNQLKDRNMQQAQDLIREPMKEAEQHIKKFPVCASQDLNAQDTKKYLPMGLTLETMYELYVQEVCYPVSIDYYHKILQLMNLKFKPLFLGKCENCEEAATKCASSKSLREKVRFNTLLNNHFIASELARKLKSQDELTAQSSDNSILLCSFGYQQSLPTPCLNDSTAYYKRPLWTYNLTIQQNSGKKEAIGSTKFYMWHEAQGRKTVNELASCLYLYLQSLPPTVKCVIIGSNSWCRESRSKTICMMFSHLIANHKTLETIEHKFLLSSPCRNYDDLDGHLAEKIMKKYQGSIQQPKDWYSAFSKPLESNNKPEVVVMTPEAFYDFESLWKNPLEEVEPFIGKEVKWLRYTKKGVVCYMKSCTESFRFKFAMLKLKSQCEAVWKATLRNLETVPITMKKKKDLLDLLPLMSPDVKSFYEGLPVEGDVVTSFVLNNVSGSLKGNEESSSKLKRNLEDSDNLENMDLPKEVCIIKSEVDLGSNDEEFEKEETQSKRTSDNEIQQIKIVSSETIETSEKIAMDEDVSLEDDDPFSSKSIGEKKLSSNPRKNCRNRKIWKQLPPCPEKCHLKILESDQKQIFNTYSQLETLDSKLDFVSAMIKVISITSDIRTVSNTLSDENPCIFYDTKFCFNTEKGCQNICRNCFVHILGERDCFITKVLEVKLQKIVESKNLTEEKQQSVNRNSTISSDNSLKLATVEYFSTNTKCLSVEKLQRGFIPLPPCRNRCSMTITKNDQIRIFESYWQGATFYSRFKFINDMIHVKYRSSFTSNRFHQLSAQYYLNSEKGRQRVCRTCFVLVIDETNNFIRTVLGKALPKCYQLKQSEKESHPPEEIDENLEDESIKEDIHPDSFSKDDNLSSKSNEHLILRLSSQTEALGSTSSPEEQDKKVEEHTKILAQTDVKFNPSFFGKCETCEVALQKLRTVNDPSARHKIDFDRTAHLIESQEAINSKLRDEEAARNITSVKVCSFAFQKSLPTPCLNKLPLNYKHSLCTYNLVVQGQISYKCQTVKTSDSYMWHEAEGKRTANEIASCLYDYLQNLSSSVKSLIIYSTSCNGESRSKTLSRMFLNFVANHETLKTVDHKFLISGHSKLEKNLDNGWIELIKEHRGKIEVPNDWCRAVNSSPQSSVVIMNPKKFYDFEKLWKDCSDEDKPFIDETVKWLRYTKAGVVYYKTNWWENDRFHLLNLKSRSKDMSKAELCILGEFPITKEKQKEISNLLPFMNLQSQSFYKRLLVKTLTRKDEEKLSSILKRNLKKIPKQKTNDLPVQNCIIKEEVHLVDGDLDYIDEEIEEPPKKISKKT